MGKHGNERLLFLYHRGSLESLLYLKYNLGSITNVSWLFLLILLMKEKLFGEAMSVTIFVDLNTAT